MAHKDFYQTNLMGNIQGSNFPKGWFFENKNSDLKAQWGDVMIMIHKLNFFNAKKGDGFLSFLIMPFAFMV